MSNPGGKGGENTRFSPGVSGNPGGRTPTAWLRELLSAAHDKSPDGRSRREAIALHLVEVATSWEVIVKGHGDDAMPVASAKDSIAAGALLWAYDMGKPVESIEVKQNTGPKVMIYLPAKGGKPSIAPVQPPSDSADVGDGK